MKTLIIVIGLLSFANAKAALQPNADAMQALLEASADIRIVTAENKEGLALSSYLAKNMAQPKGAPYVMTDFSNLCQNEVAVPGEIKCELYVSSSKMMNAPGPEGQELSRVVFQTHILPYQMKWLNGKFVLVTNTISVFSR